MLILRKDDPVYANSFSYAAFKLHRDFVLLQRQIDKTPLGRFIKSNPLGRLLHLVFELAHPKG